MRANEYVKHVIEEKGLTLYAVDKSFGNDYRGSDFYTSMNGKRYFTMKQILALEKILSIPAETILALQIEDKRHDALKSMAQDVADAKTKYADELENVYLRHVKIGRPPIEDLSKEEIEAIKILISQGNLKQTSIYRSLKQKGMANMSYHNFLKKLKKAGIVK